jgi:hypothetical protein
MAVEPYIDNYNIAGARTCRMEEILLTLRSVKAAP